MQNIASKLITATMVVSMGLVACSGGDDGNSSGGSSGGGSSGGGSNGGGSNGGGSSGGGSNGGGSNGGGQKPSGATSKTCSSTDDCGNWFCDCKDESGDLSPVNSRNCTNGYCMDAATSCPKACTAFGKTWVGTAGGGPDN